MELICFATKGAGSNEEERIWTLLEPLSPHLFDFDRSEKHRSFLRLLREIHRRRPDLVVMEGTGIGGGSAVLIAHGLWHTRFVVSSGDAVAPFISATRPALRLAAELYERLLYRCSAGFIGWTPYLVGRALTWGARRAMAAPGWAPYQSREDSREKARLSLGIPDSAIVFGLVGALIWNDRVAYCYGHELVRALRRVDRQDIYVVVAGSGTGTTHLEREAGPLLGTRVLLPGPIPQSDVPSLLSAMDVVSLPQSVDGVGSFRYTTKVSEYLQACRPIVTGQIPFAYEFDEQWLWRLPGDAPWDDRYIDGLASLMQSVTLEEIETRRAAIPEYVPAFDPVRQQRQVVSFIRDLAADGG